MTFFVGILNYNGYKSYWQVKNCNTKPQIDYNIREAQSNGRREAQVN
jgi:hypothetical protein